MNRQSGTCCSDEDSWRVKNFRCTWCGRGHTSAWEESCGKDAQLLKTALALKLKTQKHFSSSFHHLKA